MTFEKVELLNWIKTQPDNLVDLAMSGMPSPANVSQLGVVPGDVPLFGDNLYGWQPLKECLAERYGTSVERIAIAPGASMAISAVLAALMSEVREIAVEIPAYEPFKRVSRVLSGNHPLRLKRLRSKSYHLDGSLPQILKNRPLAVVTTNLHNPSGVYDRPETFIELADEISESGGWLVVDEVFLPFITGGDYMCAAATHDRIISISSLTKTWGLWGLRIGWIIGPAWLMRRVEEVMDHFHVVQPFITEYLAQRFLSDEDQNSKQILKARNISSRNLQIVESFLKEYQEFQFTKPDGGISILIELPEEINADRFCSYLLEEHNTLVVPGRFFDVSNGFRLSFGVDDTTLERGLDALRKTLKYFG